MNKLNSMNTVNTINRILQRPLFPTGRLHLIAISKTVDANRAVPPLLIHAGIDPIKTRFVDATSGCTVGQIEKAITPGTEVLVVWNLPALVDYSIESDPLVLKMMRELQL